MTRTLAVATAFVLLLSACGETKIDSGKVENLIEDSLAPPKPDRVSCPEDVKAEKGKTFVCRLEYPGRAPARLTVHIEDDEGRVRFDQSDLAPGL
jgi:hypothetical protein